MKNTTGQRADNTYLQAVFDSVSDAILVYDADTMRITDINQGVEAVYGYSRAEALRLPLGSLSQGEPPSSLIEAREWLSKARALGPQTFEWRAQHKDGHLFWAEVNVRYTVIGGNRHFVVVVRDITGRKRTEGALHTALANLTRAQRVGKLGSWEWHVQENSLSWSAELYQIWGVGEDFPLTFDSIAALVHPDDRALNLAWVQKFLADLDQGGFDFRIICPDGVVRHIHQSVEVTRTPAGQPEKLFGIMQDITERKQAEEALRVSEERLRLAHKAANDVIWDWDIVRDEQRWNPAGATVFGWADIVAAPQTAAWWLDRVHPDDRPRVDAGFFAAVTDPACDAWRAEYRFRKADGGYVEVMDRGYILRDAHGEAVRMIGAMQDITERKQLEAALREKNEELVALNAIGHDVNASLAVDHATAAALTGVMNSVQPDQAYLFLREGERLILAQTLTLAGLQAAGPLLPEHRVGACVCGLAAQEQRAFFARDVATDARCTWHECKEAGVRSFAALPLLSEGEAIGVIGLASFTERDFAAQAEFLGALASQVAAALVNARLFAAVQAHAVQLEAHVEARTRELHEAQEKLVRHERLAVLGQLAGSVGHELRNPLAVISNAIYYLKLVRPQADAKLNQYLDMIEREVQNAEKIIGDLLDFARVKSAAREAVAVRPLVDDVLARFPPPEGVRVTLDLPADLPAVYADPRHVAQVLGNLVANACQAMPGGGELAISAGQPAAGGQGAAGGEPAAIAISVRDTGTGIPPENMSKLFEPLFTTKTKGIGLGLAVSRKLIEANDGRIEVTSEVGAGSTFTIYLPAAADRSET